MVRNPCSKFGDEGILRDDGERDCGDVLSSLAELAICGSFVSSAVGGGE